MATKTDVLSIEQAAILGYSMMIDELVQRRAALAHSIMDGHGELAASRFHAAMLDEPRQFAKKHSGKKQTTPPAARSRR